ncbi:MAG: arginase family protein [Gemmatimonadales bacterium]
MHLHIVSVPFDSGVRNVRMGNGPQYLLAAGLREHLEGQGHQVTITELDPAFDPLTPEPTIMLELNRQLAGVVADALRRGAFPLVLAGSCYTAVGTVTGMGSNRTGVFWFDSHGDFNTPDTSGSGFLDGMAITMLAGRSWQHLLAGLANYRPVPESHICLVGVRDIDPPERALLDASAVQALGPDQLDRGLQRVLEGLPGEIDQIYLHLDLDVLDPEVAKANALAAPGGPDVAQTAGAIARIGAALPIRGMALTAFDPGLGDAERVSRAARTLVEAALRS